MKSVERVSHTSTRLHAIRYHNIISNRLHLSFIFYYLKMIFETKKDIFAENDFVPQKCPVDSFEDSCQASS